MTKPTINLADATLDELSSFLAERLEALRRLHNQRIPGHIADPKDCTCQPPCYAGFDRDWTPAEPHVETLLEAMCRAGYWYKMGSHHPEQRRPGYYWVFGRKDTLGDLGFDDVSPLLAAYRAAVNAVVAVEGE